MGEQDDAADDKELSQRRRVTFSRRKILAAMAFPM
jgi:hypothetical protein